MQLRLAPLAILILSLTVGVSVQAATTAPSMQVPATASDLARIFTPRDENDATLDSTKQPDNETVSVYPKVENDPNADALTNIFNTMSANQHYLTEEDVRRMVDYFEWALEAPLVNSERNALRKLIIAEHDKDGGQSRAYQFLAKSVSNKIGNVYLDAVMNPFDEWQRQELQREYLPILQNEAQQGEPLAQWLMTSYEAIQPPLTAGHDPLRPQVAKVYVDHVIFALNEIAGATPEEPLYKATPDLQLKIAQQLVAAWPSLDEAKRQELVNMPFDWAATVKDWPSKTEVEKTKARIAWGNQFTPSFPELVPLHKERVAAYAEAEAKAKAEKLAREKAEAERIAKLTPEQRMNEELANQQLMNMVLSNYMQSKMQMQQQNFQLLSNTLQSGHETNMNIISNMGGNSTWRYEYVYKP
ncbi:MAG: hypothetical protein E6Q83_16765 [Thiothrix sp.]|nr:MAG: hypothetical protein E6Q83_16765 [Thiothrix sp.]